VIRTRQPLCIANVEVWCKEEERTLPIPPIPKSWLGVPMMLEDRVLGVISLQSDEFENLYGRDDQEVLQAMASQAAIALDNAALLRKIREEQTKNVATGRLAAVHSVTAEFVHRMNNVAGTIPVRVEQIKELLDLSDSKYSKIVHYLEAILEDTDSILEAAQTITSSTRTTESLELVDIDTLVSTAIQRIAVPTGITVENKCEPDLPSVLAFSGQLLDTLENLIRNGVEAIEDSGSVTIVGRPLMEDGQRWVAVEIEDTGHGIPPGDLPRIFDLFFSTKPGGMGFGLWGAKTLIESLGGRIDVSSEVGKGTTFTILLSAEKEA